MVYLFFIDNEYITYVGNPPKTENTLTILPEKLLDFYTHIHDGWFESISGGVGLLPMEKIQFLNESEWGLTDEILQSVDLSKTYYVFHNGGNGFLCINIEKGTERWQHDDRCHGSWFPFRTSSFVY